MSEHRAYFTLILGRRPQHCGHGGGEGGSQKKCEIRDFFAELWPGTVIEMYNNQR